MRKIYRASYKILMLPFVMFNFYVLVPRLFSSVVKQRFEEIRYKYSNVFTLFNKINTLDRSSDGYSWGSWTGKIRGAFNDGVPIGFLSNPLISFTMVFSGSELDKKRTQIRINICNQILGYQVSKQLLLEDYVGVPLISNTKFMTSANRAHHACHIAYYYKLIGKHLWNADNVVEWGGGYGNMSRIIRRMNPNLTYIIVDLPELLSLQYVYLGSLEGENNINIICSNNDSIMSGKVNLISSEFMLANNFNIKCDAFISTWALSECPKYIQQFVCDNSFFSAKNIFIASCIDENNHIEKLSPQRIYAKLPVPDLLGHHEYWSISSNNV